RWRGVGDERGRQGTLVQGLQDGAEGPVRVGAAEGPPDQSREGHGHRLQGLRGPAAHAAPARTRTLVARPAPAVTPDRPDSCPTPSGPGRVTGRRGRTTPRSTRTSTTASRRRTPSTSPTPSPGRTSTRTRPRRTGRTRPATRPRSPSPRTTARCSCSAPAPS